MYSLSPITKTKYKLPKKNDSEGIKNFLKKNKGKQVVVVLGLGFVGSAMALVVANSSSEYAVIGIDLPTESSYWKIGSINDGHFPIISSDPKIDKYFKNTLNKENFYATHDVQAFSEADIIIVDINLDVKKSYRTEKDCLEYDVDLRPFSDGIKSIAQNCKENALLLVETTVPPGTCLNIVKPICKKYFEVRGLDFNELKIGHSYERVTPGPNYIDSIENFYRVYSGINDRSSVEVRNFLESIIQTSEYPLTKLSNTNSTEMSKVLENSYRAMNIAFIQEWTEFAENAGVNLYEVIDGIKIRPTHSNIMRPGLGVGGYCLTKDPLLASWASQNIFNSNKLSQSESAVKINDNMPMHTFKEIYKAFNGNISGLSVLIFGVSYLNDIGDTRYTPVGSLYNSLQDKGANIILHDPYLTNWHEMNIEIKQELPEDNFDILVITVPHKQFSQELYFRYINKKAPKLVVDTFGFLLKSEYKLNSSIEIITIGNGE